MLKKIDKLESVTGGGAALFLLFFLSFYLHPYYGIRHDAVLYLGQALLSWQPDQFGRDLFFAYGSQAQFTLFPRLLAFFLPHLGAAELFKWATGFALVAFVTSSAFLLWRLFPVGYPFLGLLSLIVLPSGYGGLNVFSYAEPFFTARSLAEPLVLVSVALWLCGRWLTAGTIWSLAATLHPLQALPVLLVVWLDCVCHNRRWLNLLWFVLPVLVAGVLGLKPFDWLVVRYDEDWFSWITEPNKHVFVSSWQPSAWGCLLTDLFLGWLIASRAEGRLLRLARALWFSAIAGVVASLILADGLRFAFATGLQLWRAQWLLHWLVMACVPWLLTFELKGDLRPSARFNLLLAIVVFGTPNGRSDYAALAVLFFIPLYMYWEYVKSNVRPRLLQIVTVVIPTAMLLMLAKHIQTIGVLYANAGGGRDVIRPEFMFFSFPMVAGGVSAVGIWLWHRRLGLQPALLVFLLVACVHASSEWDRRSSWTRFIESAQYKSTLFGVELKSGAEVFWVDELLAPWLILNRPSYFNGHQSAGLLFSRGTAEEFHRRKQVFGLLEFQTQVCRLMNELNKNANSDENCAPTDEAVAEACTEAAGGLDYLILNQPLAHSPVGVWKIAGGRKGGGITYSLYQCSDFLHNTKETLHK